MDPSHARQDCAELNSTARSGVVNKNAAKEQRLKAATVNSRGDMSASKMLP